MRVLLDESLPLRLADQLEGVSEETVFDRAWSGLKNGDLLRAAEEDFEAFVSADQQLPYQQNLGAFALRVVILAARTNRLEDISPLVPEALAQLRRLEEGEVAVVRADSR